MEKIKEIIMIGLAVLISLGFFVTLFILIFTGLYESTIQLVVGTLLTAFGTIVGYFFGSSKGSAEKNVLLKDSPGEIYGCTNPKAKNYNPSATKDNGTCIFEAIP